MNMGRARKALTLAIALASVSASLPLTAIFAAAAPEPLVVTPADLVFPQFGATPSHSFDSNATGRGFNTSLVKWNPPISLTAGSSVVADFRSVVRLNNTTSAPDVLGVVWAYPSPVFGTSLVTIAAGNNASFMWSYPMPGGIFATPIAADVNGDGLMDLVVRTDTGHMEALTPNITWDGSSYSFPAANVTELQAQQLWNFTVSGAASTNNNLSTPIAVNLVGSASPEILAPAGDRLFLINGATGAEIRNVTVDGTLVSAPAVSPFGAGARVYVTSTNRTTANLSTVASDFIVTAFDGSLNFLWNATFPQTYDTAAAYKSLDLQLPSPATGELDGAGGANDMALVTPYENSLAHLRIYYNGSNSPSFNTSLLGLTGSAPAVVDLDSDGRAEIVALSYRPGTPFTSPNSQAFLEVFAGNGTRLWNITIDEVPGAPRENTLAPPAIGDLNEDGVKDIVVLLTDGASEVRSGTNGSRITRHQFFDQATPTEFSGPCVADLDRDGFLDITANAAAVSFALADLHLNGSDIALNNTQPEQFEDVQVTATIHNGGNAFAANVTVAFFDGVQQLGETTLGLILAGGSAQAQVTLNFTGGGPRTLIVVADANHTIDEISETNNTAALAVNVTSHYGFRFESPANRSAVQPGFSNVFILNAISEGTSDNLINLTVGTLPVNWTGGLAPLNLTLTPAGTPGDTNTSFLTITVDVGATQGVYDIEVRGVSANSSRNTARIIFSVIIGGQYAASLFPNSGAQNVTAGDTAIYTLEIINAGNSPDTFTFTNSSPPAGWTVTLTRTTSPPLQPNGRTTFSVTVRAPASAVQGDNATVVVTARSQNDTSKTDTATFVTRVVVPDLVVDSVRFFRACAGEAFFGAPSLIQGESSRIQATVRNAALNAHVSSLRVRIWVEGIFTDVPTTIGPDGIGTANVSYAYTVGGAKWVTATVDPGNLINELDEGNNDLTAQVTVKDPSPVGPFTVSGFVLKGGGGVAGATVSITNPATGAFAETTTGPAGNYSATFSAAQFADGDRLTVNATDGLDIGSATVCAYSEDVQVAADIALGLPSPYDFLLVSVGPTDREGMPGSNVTYDVQVQNRGPFNSTILLSATGIWSARVRDANGTTIAAVLLPPTGTVTVTVEVLVPTGAAPGASAVTALNATAAADFSRVRGLALRTTAGVLRSLDLSLDVSTGSALTGTDFTVNLTVFNLGNGPEDVAVTATCTGPSPCSGWVVVAPSPITVGVAGSGGALATIHVAANALGGAYTVNFTAAAANDSAVNAIETFTLTAIEVRHQFAVTGPSSLRLVPGETRSTNITVTNRGTVADTILVSTAQGSGGYLISLGGGASVNLALDLSAGASAQVMLSVSAPLEVDRESFQIDVLFESLETQVQELLTVTATIGPFYDFRVESVRLSANPQVNVEVQVVATVSNGGAQAPPGDILVRLLIAGEVYATQSVSGLGGGRSEDVVFRWTPRTSGTVNISADVNRAPGSSWYESSFSNNVASGTYIVTPPQAGGILSQGGWLLFVVALIVIMGAVAAVSRRKETADEPAKDPEEAKEEIDERRKGKDNSGGLGRI